MTIPRRALAVSLAAATLAVLLGVIAMGGALRAGLAQVEHVERRVGAVESAVDALLAEHNRHPVV